MKTINGFILLLAVLYLGSCTSARPISLESRPPSGGGELITQSLFHSDDQTISEEDIQRLLNGRIKIPDSLRVAVYKHGSSSMNRYYSYYRSDEEFLKTQQSYIDTLTAKLGQAQKVAKTIVVPSMMTSQNPTIVQLREAAVRLQADLLLVFSVNSDTYNKYKAFQKNESKAFATCETILMDTRTGVIPHTNIVTRENLVRKEQEDWSNEEMRKRAENGAVVRALVQTGDAVVQFLEE